MIESLDKTVGLRALESSDRTFYSWRNHEPLGVFREHREPSEFIRSVFKNDR